MSTKWGIIGTGTHADTFIAPALRSAEDTGLVAICDIDRGRAGEFAARHEVENIYDSLDSMLDGPELDAVWIATLNSLHAQQTIMECKWSGLRMLFRNPPEKAGLSELSDIMPVTDSCHFFINFH